MVKLVVVCFSGYRHNNLCLQANIATQCSFHGVVMMLLWLLMGSLAEVENKGLSVWPDNTIG